MQYDAIKEATQFKSLYIVPTVWLEMYAFRIAD